MLSRILSSLSLLSRLMVVMGGLLSHQHHAFAQPVASEVATPVIEVASTSAGTARQRAYLDASINQRTRLIEALGEEGSRAFAQKKGWTPIYDGVERFIAQGPDQVYSAADDIGHVIESKGGGSPLGRGYGHVQGSPEWAVESAKSVLRNPRASAAERKAAEFVIQKAAQGKLQVHVVRTSHVLGEPTAAVLERTTLSTIESSRLARAALDEAAAASATVVDDVGRVVNDVARSTATTGNTVLKTAAKVALPVAVAVDAGLRVSDGIETERKFAAGEITVQQREVEHATNAAGMAGGWGGAAGGAWVAGEVAAPLAAMTGPAAPYVEGAAVVAGGIAGYYYGEEGAKQAAEWTVHQVHAAGTTISESATNVWGWTSGQATGAWQYVFGN